MEQAKEPTQHVDEEDQNGSKDCSFESEDNSKNFGFNKIHSNSKYTL